MSLIGLKIFSIIQKKKWLSNKDIEFLDIGCGVGWSLLVANENKCKSYGVEPVKTASEYANNTLKVNVINSLFKSSLFKEHKFDFIMMDQVLEHISNPMEFMQDAFTLLKPGGLFFLACPPLDWSRLLTSASYQLPKGIIDYIHRSTYLSKFVFKYDTFCYPEGHINYFSTKAISILANICGAEVLEQYHFNKNRVKFFPFFKLSTGSFFLRKKYFD